MPNGCDKETTSSQESIKENKENIVENFNREQEGVLVQKSMPQFKMEAYDSATGHYTEVSSEDYKGKWTVVCFIQQILPFCMPQTGGFAGNWKLEALFPYFTKELGRFGKVFKAKVSNFGLPKFLHIKEGIW